MEQLTQCNKCGLEWLAYIEEDEEPTGEEFACPACGSDDTTCI